MGDSGRFRWGCFVSFFFKAKTLSLWLHDLSCATAGFEVHWGKSVFVSLGFFGCVQALTQDYQLPVHEVFSKFNSESLKPIQKYVITYLSDIPFSYLLLSFWWMNDFIIHSLKDILKSCLNNSIKHSVKIIILPKPICIWIKQTPSGFFFSMCRHKLKILDKHDSLMCFSPHSHLN